VAFSALWLVPRLHRFRRRRPDVDVRLSATSTLLDLERDRIDVAVRYCAPESAPRDAVKLFSGDVVPVCSPSVARDRSRPLRRPQDLARHVLLHYDDPTHPMPWHAWSTWLEAAGVPDLTPAGAVHFSHLDHAIRAAIDGEGVALGVRSVLRDQFASGTLVMPFARTSPANRGYFALVAPKARSRPEAKEFVDWLLFEAGDGAEPSDVGARGQLPRRGSRRTLARSRISGE
jgi:DNA-binding transcriptional LysR family regulator